MASVISSSKHDRNNSGRPVGHLDEVNPSRTSTRPLYLHSLNRVNISCAYAIFGKRARYTAGLVLISQSCCVVRVYHNVISRGARNMDAKDILVFDPLLRQPVLHPRVHDHPGPHAIPMAWTCRYSAFTSPHQLSSWLIV